MTLGDPGQFTNPSQDKHTNSHMLSPLRVNLESFTNVKCTTVLPTYVTSMAN